jgi:hypothetical protein
MHRFLAVLFGFAALAAAAPALATAQVAAPYYLELNDGLRYKGLSAVALPGTPGTFGVSVFRATGFVTGRGTHRGRVQLFFDPAPGDTVIFHGSGREPLAVFQWDGSPVVTSACVGSRVVSGTAAGMTIERAGRFTFLPGRYSPRREEAGQLAAGPGGAFTSTLTTPLRLRDLVYAVAFAHVPNLFVRTAVEAPVSPVCPDRVAPRGRILPIAALRRATVLRRGVRARIRLDEAARISTRLYAVRTRRSGGRTRTSRVLVGTAQRTTARAGTSRVRIKVRRTRRARRAVRRAMRLEVRATVRDASGNRRTLRRRSVRLRRR